MSLDYATRAVPQEAWPASPGVLGDEDVQWITSVNALDDLTEEIETLHLESSAADQVTAKAAWRLAVSHHAQWAQRILLFRRGGTLQAVVYLRERLLGGIPTGYLQLDATQGEVAVVCQPGRENAFLQKTVAWLLRGRRCFLLLLSAEEDSRLTLVRPGTGTTTRRTVLATTRWSTPLLENFDTTIQGLGRRTRRNLRYALRRAEKNGWEFVPLLDLATRDAAIHQLAARSTHPLDAELLRRRLMLLEEVPALFAMGLRDREGHWLSCLVGRRVADRTEVFWQLNEAGQGSESICLTMRALMMCDQLKTGSRRVEYVAGTGSQMRLCCAPSVIRETSLSRPGLRRWLLSVFLRLNLTRLGQALDPHLR